MNTFFLAFRYLCRDWRHPELRILVWAVVIAVTAVSAVNFFTDRLSQVMEQQASELLGADLRISSSEPLPPAFQEYAGRLHLQTATWLSFYSVILYNDDTLLTEVKAVSEGYPLRGQLRIAGQLYGTEAVTSTIPASGKIWVEERVLTQLGLKIGEKVALGEMNFTIDKVLTLEPDRGGLFFQLSPRVLMNLADAEKTRLIREGSRVKYGLLVAGSVAEVETYRRWLEEPSRLLKGQRLEGVKDGNRELRLALQRAEQFLGLAAILAVLLAGAAVAVAAQYFSQKEADASAIMRCFGATQKLIVQIYLLRLFGWGILASGGGCVIGWLAQQGLAMILGNYFSILMLPAPSFRPVFMGLATGLITLLGFALLPILQIRHVPPVRVLRHDLETTRPALGEMIVGASVAMTLLIFWQADDPTLAIWMIGGTWVTLLMLLGTAYGLVYSLRLFRGRANVAWRFGLTNVGRRAHTSSVQLMALGLGIMALLLLAVVRIDLLESWQGRLPEGTPNHFMVNIQPEEVGAVQVKLISELKLPPSSKSIIMYPMIRAQLVTLNDQAVSAENYSNLRAKQLVGRTFNLSYVTQLPESNKIVAGRFWEANEARQLSVEEGFAKELGLQLGDVLQFRVAHQEVKAQITSLRSVQWDSFQVNFFILASPDVLQDLPATYLTSFYLPHTASGVIAELVREFPSVTVMNVDVLMAQVRRLMERASLAIEFVFGFTLLASLMVLYAAISASHEERLYESAILRTLGATRRQVLWGLIAEFSVLGLLAGILAAIAASGFGYLLAAHVFDLPYHFNPGLGLLGGIGGTFGVGLAGVLGTYRVLQSPPLAVLQWLKN